MADRKELAHYHFMVVLSVCYNRAEIEKAARSLIPVSFLFTICNFTDIEHHCQSLAVRHLTLLYSGGFAPLQ